MRGKGSESNEEGGGVFCGESENEMEIGIAEESLICRLESHFREGMYLVLTEMIPVEKLQSRHRAVCLLIRPAQFKC